MDTYLMTFEVNSNILKISWSNDGEMLNFIRTSLANPCNSDQFILYFYKVKLDEKFITNLEAIVTSYRDKELETEFSYDI